ncbi:MULTISPECIES: alpha/beta hydrolase [Amycolatopsis]|uniref:Alpha/beta hydrolase n=1 Tax=Amycolatopsis dongchuanensis TaxID=1070866 RepID=A0ABP8VCG8_9PSEU
MDRSILGRPGPDPDEVVRYGASPDQAADIWRPREVRHPALVLIHGGFWRPRYDRTHTRPMAAALRAEGWPVASLEYRREPGNPDACTEDVKRALEFLPGELPGEGVVLAGHSAGGHLALWVAVTCPPAGLLGTVALAPVADLRQADDANLGDGAVRAFLGGPAETRPDLDPVRLDEPAAPVALVHGTEDTGVPSSVSKSYVDSHPRVRLVLLPGIAHFELIDPESAAWPRVLRELEAAGRPARRPG